MLKKTIHYKHFDGTDDEEVAYFNLSKAELVEAEIVTYSPENKEAFLRQIVLAAYGVRTGSRTFTKSKEAKRTFEFSAPYRALIQELMANEAVASKFVMGVAPYLADDLLLQHARAVLFGEKL